MEALYYQTDNNIVTCVLCPHYCLIKPNGKGSCKNRKNKEGKLYTLAFGNTCSEHIDPIEKKPFYHFFPKTEVFSIATGGCNFACLNCQNYTISQAGAEEISNNQHSPENIVLTCLSAKCRTIAYTYTEPSVFYEYMLATARHAKERGVKNIIVSNGYINPKPLEELSVYLDAANIDLKCFDDAIYKKLAKGSLEPVLNTLVALKKKNIWLEITNLIIPGWTDDLKMIGQMCQWMAENNMQDCPLHFSRFSPTYKLNNAKSTPVETLIQARNIALSAGIKYVYIGNVYGNTSENTYCPKCSEILVERKGYRVGNINIVSGKCSFCNETIAGVWE